MSERLKNISVINKGRTQLLSDGTQVTEYHQVILKTEDYEYLIQQAERAEKYKQALEFYADFYKYNYGGDKDAMKQVSQSVITKDGGVKARQALENKDV